MLPARTGWAGRCSAIRRLSLSCILPSWVELGHCRGWLRTQPGPTDRLLEGLAAGAGAPTRVTPETVATADRRCRRALNPARIQTETREPADRRSSPRFPDLHRPHARISGSLRGQCGIARTTRFLRLPLAEPTMPPGSDGRGGSVDPAARRGTPRDRCPARRRRVAAPPRRPPGA